jgi:hypothetical protein
MRPSCISGIVRMLGRDRRNDRDDVNCYTCHSG